MTTVLVVDDSPSILTMLGVVLRESGYQVHEASSGIIALNRSYRQHQQRMP